MKFWSSELKFVSRIKQALHLIGSFSAIFRHSVASLELFWLARKRSCLCLPLTACLTEYDLRPEQAMKKLYHPFAPLAVTTEFNWLWVLLCYFPLLLQPVCSSVEWKIARCQESWPIRFLQLDLAFRLCRTGLPRLACAGIHLSAWSPSLYQRILTTYQLLKIV